MPTILTIAALAAFVPAAWAQDSIGCFVTGQCSGGFLGASSEDDAVQCLEACKGTTGCQYFTYQTNDNACLLFATCSLNPSCTDCISGDVECVTMQCDLEGLCYGNLVSLDSAGSDLACSQECQSQDLCAFWSFDQDQGICIQTEDCDYFEPGEDFFIAGERDCEVAATTQPPVQQNLNKVIVAGGFDSSGRLDSAELVDLVSETCPTIQDFPIDNEESEGINFNGVGLVCGGYGQGQENEAAPFRTCWRLETDGSWSTGFPSMNTARYRHSAMVWDDGTLWITGGKTFGGTTIASTEVFDDAQSDFVAGDNLPLVLEDHCIVQVSEFTAMLVGGANLQNQFRSQVYLYDRRDSSWTEQQNSMIDGRYGHTCNLVESSRGLELIAAGGGSDSSRVEVYSFATSTWSQGPALPNPTRWAESVPYEDTFLLVGGSNGQGQYYDSFLEYDVENKAWISRGDLNLGTGRSRHAAMMMDSADLECV